MIEKGKVLLIVCLIVFCPIPGSSQDAIKGADPTWDSDIWYFGDHVLHPSRKIGTK